MTKAKTMQTETPVAITNYDTDGDFFSESLIQLIQHRPANSVATFYLLRPPGAKW